MLTLMVFAVVSSEPTNVFEHRTPSFPILGFTFDLAIVLLALTVVILPIFVGVVSRKQPMLSTAVYVLMPASAMLQVVNEWGKFSLSSYFEFLLVCLPGFLAGRDGSRIDKMGTGRRVVAAATLALGIASWLATMTHRYGATKFYELFWLIFVLAACIGLFSDLQSAVNKFGKRLSPAASGLLVVIGTGGAATVVLARETSQYLDYFTSIAALSLVTGLVSFAVFRFASKNRDQIGEARFKTTSGADHTPNAK